MKDLLDAAKQMTGGGLPGMPNNLTKLDGTSPIGDVSMEARTVNREGRLEFFAVKKNGELFHTWQVRPNCTWNQRIAGNGFAGPIVMSKSADGRIEMFAIKSNGDLYHTWQIENLSWKDRIVGKDFGSHMAIT
jgi:hypothetical protein